MKKFIIHPTTFKLDGGAMFGIIPKPLWARKIEPDEFNRILMSLRVIYLEIEDKKILIDTGIGDYHSEKFNHQFAIENTDSPLTTILRKHLDVDPTEITDVIITHLHFDHVGGLIERDKEMTFPNATLHLHKKHYEYSQEPTARDTGSFQSHFFNPIIQQYIDKEQIHFLEGENGLIINSATPIKFKVSFGHTPYMIHPIFENYIYMADLVPMAHHLKIPWVMGYDIEPGVTTKYKEEFYKFIIENDLCMIYEHDNETWGSKIKLDDKQQYVFTENFQSSKGFVQELE